MGLFLLALLCVGGPAAADPHDLVLLEITDLGGCRGCAGSLERALDRLEAVHEATLEADRPVVRVRLAPDAAFDAVALRTAVRDRGYTVGRIEIVWDGVVAGPPWTFAPTRDGRRYLLRAATGTPVAAGATRLRARVVAEGEALVLEALGPEPPP